MDETTVEAVAVFAIIVGVPVFGSIAVVMFGSAISEIGDLLHDIVYCACEDYRMKTFGKSKKEMRDIMDPKI